MRHRQHGLEIQLLTVSHKVEKGSRDRTVSLREVTLLLACVINEISYCNIKSSLLVNNKRTKCPHIERWSNYSAVRIFHFCKRQKVHTIQTLHEHVHGCTLHVQCAASVCTVMFAYVHGESLSQTHGAVCRFFQYFLTTSWKRRARPV